MADDEKNEEIEETEETAPEVEAEVPGTEADVEAVPSDEEVPGTVSDSGDEPTDEPAAEEEAAPAAPVKPSPSRRHVPRALRRTRSKPKRETASPRKPITRTEKPESELGRRQERRGVVVSDKGDKTIIVKVDQIKSHPKYKKVIRRSVRFHAHDEGNTAGVGDTVRIVETRPLSKLKRWRLAEIVEKAK
jgi:small subunit ribosomal protein S17